MEYFVIALIVILSITHMAMVMSVYRTQDEKKTDEETVKRFRKIREWLNSRGKA